MMMSLVSSGRGPDSCPGAAGLGLDGGHKLHPDPHAPFFPSLSYLSMIAGMFSLGTSG